MRQIIVLSVALVASLVGAYLTWTDESEEPTGEAVDVYTASDKDLQKVVWDGENVDVTVERRRDDNGDYLWIESTETKKPRTPPKKPEPAPAEGEEPVDGETPAVSPEPEPEPEPEIVVTKFVGNTQAEEMWTSFAPLRSPRRLDPGSADLSTFGFGEAPAAAPEPEPAGDEHPHDGEEGEDPHDAPKKKAPEKASVQIVRDSGPITLALGGETYGAKHRYVQYDGGIYLVEQDTLRSLQGAASRLVERSLFPFEEAAIEQVDVALPDGTTFVFVQQNRDDSAKAYWARPESLEQEDETVGTWLGKVFKLRLREYVDPAEVTAPLEPVLTYTVKGKGEKWTVEIVKAAADAEGKTEWYAKSAYNRSLVTLTESLVRNVIDDLDALSAPAVPPAPEAGGE